MKNKTSKTEQPCTIHSVVCSCVDDLLPLIADNYKAWDEYHKKGEQTKIKTGFINGKYFCRVSIKQLW